MVSCQEALPARIAQLSCHKNIGRYLLRHEIVCDHNSSGLCTVFKYKSKTKTNHLRFGGIVFGVFLCVGSNSCGWPCKHAFHWLSFRGDCLYMPKCRALRKCLFKVVEYFGQTYFYRCGKVVLIHSFLEFFYFFTWFKDAYCQHFYL